MACRVCGKEGGFECPTCDCDYCKEHKGEINPFYKEYGYEVIDGECEQCGDIL